MKNKTELGGRGCIDEHKAVRSVPTNVTRVENITIVHNSKALASKTIVDTGKLNGNSTVSSKFFQLNTQEDL